MIIQYGACFGTELAMNNQLATHFRVYFQMPGGQAAALAGCFGLMNLFARSLGGIFSDALFARFSFRGRIWAQFLALFGEGIFLFVFANVSNEYQWYHALAALVRAGGNAGAVFAGFAFYKQDWDDTLTPFKLHAGFVISMAILSPFFYWPEYGSMFTAPAVDASAPTKAADKDTGSEATTATPAESTTA